MKKNNAIYLLLALLVVWCPLFMGVWDKDKPATSTSLRNSNPEILANWAAIESAFDQDHEFSTGGTNSGKHEVIVFEEEASAGASSTNEAHLQIIDGGSQPEMAFTSEDGDELQFTKDGDLYSSDNLQVAGTSTFTGAITANGSITLGAGADLIGSSTSDITINTNKFTVAGATGNTVIAGTLGVTGVATLGDTSALATSGAPAADAQIANKKYVDDNTTMVPAVSGAGTGYAGEESVTLANGMIIKMGAGVAISGNATASVTYGTAFPSACISAVICMDGDITPAETIEGMSVTVRNTTTLTVENGDGTAYAFNWIAIGH